MSKKIPDDNYTSVILEEVRDQNKTLLEMMGFLSDKVQVIEVDIHGIKLDIQDVKQDATNLRSEMNDRFDTILDVIGGDVAEVKITQKDHEHRITKLESATA